MRLSFWRTPNSLTFDFRYKIFKLINNSLNWKPSLDSRKKIREKILHKLKLLFFLVGKRKTINRIFCRLFIFNKKFWKVLKRKRNILVKAIELQAAAISQSEGNCRFWTYHREFILVSRLLQWILVLLAFV